MKKPIELDPTSEVTFEGEYVKVTIPRGTDALSLKYIKKLLPKNLPAFERGAQGMTFKCGELEFRLKRTNDPCPTFTYKIIPSTPPKKKSKKKLKK